MIEYREFGAELSEQIKQIYEDSCWRAYLGDDEKLRRAFERSVFVYGAFDREKLIGFVRCVGDCEHIIIIQDLIVLTGYRGRGIGKALFEAACGRFRDVRMVALFTDTADERSNGFYRSLGMELIERGGMTAYFRK